MLLGQRRAGTAVEAATVVAMAVAVGWSKWQRPAAGHKRKVVQRRRSKYRDPETSGRTRCGSLGAALATVFQVR